jgi:hemolysin activation/secretion protein
VRRVSATAIAVAISQSAAWAAAGGAPAPHFPVLEYRVLGNNQLPVRDVERAVYPFLGEDKAFEDVEKARNALQAAYRAHDLGTVLVDIPEQDVSDGVVRLRVTEGRLRVTQISGARYFSDRKLLAEIPEARPGTVPRLGELQQEISNVNSESRDRSVVPILKAGPEPGTVDLALKVDDHLPLHGSAELNNQYTVGTTHLRANLAVDYANMFDTLGDLSLQYQTSPEKTSQVGIFVAGYTTGPMIGGLKASATYLNSSSSVPAVGSLGVLGKGDIWSGRLSLPIVFTAATTQSAFVGLDYKHFTQDIEVDPTTSLQTPISYLNWSTGYEGDWRGPVRVWSLASSVNFGIRSLVNDPDAFENKRYLARPNYFYLRDDGTVIQKLGNWSLRLRLAGQYAIEPLVVNEDFVIAGADGVRGYLESEQLGDTALKGTLQLDSPAWHVGPRSSGQLFVFFDAGHMHVIDSLPDTPDHALLRSVGGGIDLTAGFGMTGSLTWAYPLVTSTATREGQQRILFVIRGAF